MEVINVVLQCFDATCYHGLSCVGKSRASNEKYIQSRLYELVDRACMLHSYL